MANILVTGSSRGIGLELVKQLSELPAAQVKHVFAVVRGPSSQLDGVISGASGRVSAVTIKDITSEESVQAGADEVGAALNGAGLDIVVNNAGVMPFNSDGISSMSAKELLDVFNVNVVSAQAVTAGFLPLLRKGSQKKIVNVSTTLGSITRAQDYRWAPAYAYKVTKAALNMLTVQWALDLDKEGFTAWAVTPGWLKTDLGSQNADLDVSVGVNAVKEMILESDRSWNGQFRNIKVAGWEKKEGPNFYDGAGVPW